jgi:hypothetical protein
MAEQHAVNVPVVGSTPTLASFLVSTKLGTLRHARHSKPNSGIIF